MLAWRRVDGSGVGSKVKWSIIIKGNLGAQTSWVQSPSRVPKLPNLIPILQGHLYGAPSPNLFDGPKLQHALKPSWHEKGRGATGRPAHDVDRHGFPLPQPILRLFGASYIQCHELKVDTPNSVWLLVLIWHFCIPSGMWFDVVSKNGCQEDTR